jgi:FkbM family methyltransferase
VNALKGLILRILRRLGWDLVPHDPLEPDWRVRSDLRDRMQVDLVLDVGANRGQYAQAMREAGWTGPMISFEPLAGDVFDELSGYAAADPLWSTKRLALGAERGTQVLHVAGNTASSSLLEMTTLHSTAAPESAVVGSQGVEVERLDRVVDDIAPEARRIWLKLDVQGGELTVLEGATGILDRVQVVEAELSLVELYEGQPLMQEVVDWLSQHGLHLIHLENGFADRTTGELLQLDGFFAR